jgi:hypothetical protein
MTRSEKVKAEEIDLADPAAVTAARILANDIAKQKLSLGEVRKGIPLLNIYGLDAKVGAAWFRRAPG